MTAVDNLTLIPKLEGIANFVEWDAALRGVCLLNGSYRVLMGEEQEYMFTSKKEFQDKHDTSKGLLLLSCTAEPLSHIANINDVSEMYRVLKQRYGGSFWIGKLPMQPKRTGRQHSMTDDLYSFAAKENFSYLDGMGPVTPGSIINEPTNFVGQPNQAFDFEPAE